MLTKKNETFTMKKYISGSHVSDMMSELKEEEPNRFRLQFSAYIRLQIKPEELSRLYEKAHTSLRERPLSSDNPSFSETTNSIKLAKHSYEERKYSLKKKLAALCA